MNEYFTNKGKSLKRLIPFIAFVVLVFELIVAFLPFIVISQNNIEVINTINDVLGWSIVGGFGFTAAEKFSKCYKKYLKEVPHELEDNKKRANNSSVNHNHIKNFRICTT